MGDIGFPELVNVLIASLVLLVVMALAAYRWRVGHHKKRAYLWFDMVVLSLVGGVLIVMAMWLIDESEYVPADVLDQIDAEKISLTLVAKP